MNPIYSALRNELRMMVRWNQQSNFFSFLAHPASNFNFNFNGVEFLQFLMEPKKKIFRRCFEMDKENLSILVSFGYSNEFIHGMNFIRPITKNIR